MSSKKRLRPSTHTTHDSDNVATYYEVVCTQLCTGCRIEAFTVTSCIFPNKTKALKFAWTKSRDELDLPDLTYQEGGEYASNDGSYPRWPEFRCKVREITLSFGEDMLCSSNYIDDE